MIPKGLERNTGRARGVVTAAGACLLAAALAAAGPAYETPTGLRADRYLPADQMTGADWRVAPAAANDGFGNTYTVTSRFGTWKAFGSPQALTRIREIQAMAQLEEVSKTEVFADAVKSSVTAPFELVAKATERPAETLKAIPGAVGRWFKTTKFKVEETYRDAQEAKQEREQGRQEGAGGEGGGGADPAEKGKEAALDYLKVTAAERKWYAKLGIDPSTDNQPLRQAVTSVARVEGLTSFGMTLAGLPSIPGTSEIRTTMNLVWSTDPWELRRRNRKRMLEAGLSEPTARAFEDNPALTLTHQTALLDVLGQLAGVGGRASVIARAIDVESRDEAQQLVSSTALLLRYHRTQEPLKEFLAGTRLPVARTAADRLVAVTLVDAVFWTEPVAAAAREFAGVYAGEAAQERQFWVAGEASAGFREGARSLGWTVRDRWQLSAPEDRAAAGR